MSDQGYKAWLETWRAKQASRSPNPNRQAAAKKAAAARMAQLEPHLLASELSDARIGKDLA